MSEPAKPVPFYSVVEGLSPNAVRECLECEYGWNGRYNECPDCLSENMRIVKLLPEDKEEKR